jgi:hypothetical protein
MHEQYEMQIIEPVIGMRVVGLQPRRRIPKYFRVAECFGLSNDEPRPVSKVKDLCDGHPRGVC